MQTPVFSPQASGKKVTIPGRIIEVHTHPAKPGWSFLGFQIIDPIPESYTIVVELRLEVVRKLVGDRYPPPSTLAELANWRDPAPIYPPRFSKHLGSDPPGGVLRAGARVDVLCQEASWAEQQYTGSLPYLVRDIALVA